VADRFNLQRFVDAQAGGIFEMALSELEGGAKRSHWIWFIFPQHRDLGRSATAKCFGLTGLDEARAYAGHPLLGPGLRAACRAVLAHLESGRSAEEVLGPIDALKLRSSMEIFAQAVPDEPLFAAVRDIA
jgi:uncharacterized protein (DUF1810 family)